MKLPFSRSPQVPRVVLASRSSQAVELLAAGGADIVEAVTTRGLIQALGAPAALVVADPADWVEAGGVTREQAAAALQSAAAQGVPVLSSQELLEHGFSAERVGKSTRASLRYYPQMHMALTSHAGGIGKTTLSLTTARAFHQYTGLPVAWVEAINGESVLDAKLNLSTPSLYQQLTEEQSPAVWEGVDLYPLSQREALALASSYDPEAVLDAIAQKHSLVVVDASPLNPIWPHIMRSLNWIAVVTIPRSDVLVQAGGVLRELEAQGATADRVLLVNMVRSQADRLVIPGTGAAYIPYKPEDASGMSPSLALPILETVYPGFGGKT